MKLKEKYNVYHLIVKGVFFLLILLFNVNSYSQTITIEDVSANEDDGVIVMSATLTGATPNPFSVDISTSDDTALLSDNDYTPIVSQTLNFNGNDGETINFNVLPTPDTNIEGLEELIISMDNFIPTGFFLFFVDITDTAIVGILNDDTGTVRVIESIPNADEEGPVNGRFLLRLSDNNNTGTSLTVNYTLTGSAILGATEDYTTTGAATFNATQLARNINILPIDDNFIEGAETVLLTITGTSSTSFTPLVGSESGTVTIADNDTAGVNVTAINRNTTEAGQTATFRVTLDSQPENPVNIALSSSDATEGTVPATVNIPVANWDSGVLVTVTGVDDVLVDGPQNYSIITGNVTSADPDYNTLNGGTVANVPVTNEDDDIYIASLTATDATATEAAEVGRNGVFTVDLGRANTTGSPIVVNFQILGTSTSTGADYASIGTTVSIPNGQETGLITINPTDDAIFEGSETVVIRLVAGTNYDLATPASARTATVTIQDNDTATLSIADVTENEDVVGGNLVFTVTLDNAVAGGTTVNYAFTNGTATGGGVDFTGVASSVTFAGTQGETETIEVPINDDDLLEESETFTIRLSGATNGVLIAGDGRATGTIGDDDNCAPTPLLSPDAPSAEFCGAIQANLNEYTDSTPPAGMELRWSQSSNPLNSGARLTPAESQDVTVQGSFFGYFYDSANNCAGGVLEIELISNEIPTIISTTGETKCESDSGLITATPSDGASIRWFDRPTGGTQIGTGSSFVTPIVDESTFFYAEAIANGCPSLERIAVEVTILETPSSGIPSNATACNLNSTQQPLSLIDLDTRLSGDVDEGEWTFVSGPATLEINQDNEVNFLEEAVGEYIFRYTTTGAQAPCTNSSTEVTITVVSDCTPDPIDLEVLKTLDNPNAILGENVIFTITVNNISANEGKNITIGDVLESGFEYVSSETSTGMYDEVSGNWIFENLQANATATLTIEATVLAGGVYTNTAELLESFPLDNNLANDTATVSLELDIPEGTDLEITKAALSSRPLVGDQIVFTIKVENKSQEGESVSQIRISEIINTDNFTIVEDPIAEPGSVYDINTGIWEIPVLERGEEATLIITVTVPNEGLFTNTATLLSSFPTDSNLENNEAVVEVTVSEPTPAEEGFLFNQFSPNGDGTNDVLKVQDSNILPDFPNLSITIFDRYGSLILERKNITDTIIWDGFYEGKQSPSGTYFYILDLGDGSKVKKGWIQLIR
ncbi:putative repeat protein (TIGR01451 family)/gliding motility-associated-like protein [Maribacter vaceletii]|uniref:Putative repeat protein (TIGR01451 family)/gliding motility-associated-like protein n=1 Tax=Maribacter vaceletii TaxID=1206816 RepID=A0A495EC13_9FLAO|nr:Calx-beta domain-containing protein [Maribacter vaceletii]RKR14093.1 putative repeat protein (TIGR01451 family)/gliding motility-associated-like protein [Maribacter vaceletii]